MPEVSDGQQRLATTTILLAAIRDYWFWKGDTLRSHKIEDDHLITVDINTTERTPKLQLNVDDNLFFTYYVLEPPDSDKRKRAVATKKSHELIVNASQIARDYINKIVETHSDANKTNVLLSWVQFIKTGAQVIVLTVPDHMDAFMMFETLNDRGLKASQADLLKNHLLSLSDNQIQQAQQQWAKMTGTLESVGEKDNAMTYLHHLLITMVGPTREREVFDKVKLIADSKSKALAFLQELAETANDYAALSNPDHSKWNAYGDATREHLVTITRDLRVTQIRPLMLAIARHFTVKEAKEAFKVFVNWSVRFYVVGVRGGLLDINYSNTAYNVSNKQITSCEHLVKALSSIVPTDAVFEANFAEARVSQNYLARYYLRTLEVMHKGNNSLEFVPNNNTTVSNLEHILPESPQGMWPDFDEETARAYHRRLGNMLLLRAEDNSVIGNAPFAEKKIVYSNSRYLLTSDIAAYDKWGIEEIESRQKEMARLAVLTWPITNK